MPITVVVRSAHGGESRLTFDGTQRVVIGRGASCDVRLPDATVSHRHASLQTRGADVVLVDEGSSNGTFVGGVRIPPRTSRILRSGDLARLGRVWIEVRMDQAPVTRDVAAATRDLALAMVAEALDAAGRDRAPLVRVVEGPDQGATLALAEPGRVYVVGRGADCDLPLADEDCSREHAALVRRDAAVFVRDRRARNGTWMGDARLPPEGECAWRTTQMLRIGRSVLALQEPISDALARLEEVPDEPIALEAAPRPPAEPPPASPPVEPPPSAATAPVTTSAPASKAKRHAAWSAVDLAVMAAALGVLALSLAGLVWLLRG